MFMPPGIKRYTMIRTTLQISGMICGICETHVNDAIRSAFQVNKVRSSRDRGETVIESELPLNRERLRQTINATGYLMLSAKEEEIAKKSLIQSILKK